MSSLLMKSCKFQATEEIFVTDIKTEDFTEETQNNDEDNHIIENVNLKENIEKQVHIDIFKYGGGGEFCHFHVIRDF